MMNLLKQEIRIAFFAAEQKRNDYRYFSSGGVHRCRQSVTTDDRAYDSISERGIGVSVIIKMTSFID